MKKEQDLYVKVTSYVKLDANVTKGYDEGNLFEKKKVVNDLFGVFSNLLSSVGAIEELDIDIVVKGQEEVDFDLGLDFSQALDNKLRELFGGVEVESHVISLDGLTDAIKKFEDQFDNNKAPKEEEKEEEEKEEEEKVKKTQTKKGEN